MQVTKHSLSGRKGFRTWALGAGTQPTELKRPRAFVSRCEDVNGNRQCLEEALHITLCVCDQKSVPISVWIKKKNSICVSSLDSYQL